MSSVFGADLAPDLSTYVLGRMHVHVSVTTSNDADGAGEVSGAHVLIRNRLNVGGGYRPRNRASRRRTGRRALRTGRGDGNVKRQGHLSGDSTLSEIDVGHDRSARQPCSPGRGSERSAA